MFNNAALDVCIGLIFIYLLYSLLATTIKELVATIFAYRARMLEKGLEQMLDGKNYSYYWYNRLWDNLYPKNKVNEKGKYHIKKSLFTNNISCHPLYVRTAENSRFSTKPSYLVADVFSDILIDLLKPNKEVPASLKDITANIKAKAENRADPLNEDLKNILLIYAEQANGDLQRFKLLIEDWYDNTMERVSGWYKKQAYTILLIIGFLLGVAFNVSTIELVDKLSTDKVARDALVQNASDYVKNNVVKSNSGSTSPTSNKNSDINSINSNNQTIKNQAKKDSSDTTGRNNGLNNQKNNDNQLQSKSGELNRPDATDNSMADARLKLKQIDSLYNEQIAKSSTIAGIGWSDYGFSEDSVKWVREGSIKCKKPLQKKWYEKIWFVLWQTITTPRKWIGFIITALAISLGAPFWFDLLNKFINLRVSGQKPDEAKKSNNSSKTAGLNQNTTPNPKAFG